MSLADATKGIPFSNGTEGQEWMAKWCDFCVHDTTLHNHPSDDGGTGCDLIGSALLGDEFFAWPEAWLPEPDDGRFFLPSRLVCLHFEPCRECGGDPGAAERAERVVEVQAYWRDNGSRKRQPNPSQNGRSTNV